jgi:hypothetical protein
MVLAQASRAPVTVLQSEHHVGEEEPPLKGIFSQARVSGIDMDALGSRLAAGRRN